MADPRLVEGRYAEIGITLPRDLDTLGMIHLQRLVRVADDWNVLLYQMFEARLLTMKTHILAFPLVVPLGRLSSWTHSNVQPLEDDARLRSWRAAILFNDFRLFERCRRGVKGAPMVRKRSRAG